MPLPASLLSVLEGCPSALVVGGAVRDWLAGGSPKDVDVEVYGMGYEDLADQLRTYGRVDLVGKQFGICKLTVGGVQYDFSIPRSSSVRNPAPFARSTVDASITPREAALRRDFTVNALAYNPRTGELLDFFNGQVDLHAGVLRHTSTKHFPEDPLRPLRAFQLASRLDFSIAPETEELCREIRHGYRQLPVERIREEWLKWATKSVRPSRGLRFLQSSQYLSFYPPLARLIGTPQDPERHPEGDVWEHTLHCCDQLAGMEQWEAAPPLDRATLMFAVLTHDIAKPDCTEFRTKDGKTRITSYGHDRQGGPAAGAFLREFLGIENPKILTRVQNLVSNHMAYLGGSAEKRLRRLAASLHPANLDELELVVRADHAGRPPRPPAMPYAAHEMFAVGRSLGVSRGRPDPFLQGRDLIEIGLKPGPHFGVILADAYKRQLEGQFTGQSDAQIWLEMNRDELERAALHAEKLSVSAEPASPDPAGP